MSELDQCLEICDEQYDLNPYNGPEGAAEQDWVSCCERCGQEHAAEVEST